MVVVLSLLKPTNVTLWIAIMGNDDNDEPYLFGESESQAHTHTHIFYNQHVVISHHSHNQKKNET